MLYGIRTDLQRRLVNDGYGVRIYIPYGRDSGFPILCVACSGTAFANVGFLLRNFFRSWATSWPETRGRRDSSFRCAEHACLPDPGFLLRFQLVNLQPRDVLGFRSQRVRWPYRSKRESRIVHGDDVLHTKKSDGVCRFARSHRRKKRVTDQGAWRVPACIVRRSIPCRGTAAVFASVVDGQPPGHANHQPRGRSPP